MKAVYCTLLLRFDTAIRDLKQKHSICLHTVCGIAPVQNKQKQLNCIDSDIAIINFKQDYLTTYLILASLD